MDGYIYDLAGNFNHAINLDDQTYDATNPTIRKIISTLGTNSVTKAKDEDVNVRVYFSEDVTADNAVTVTLETQDNSGVDGTAVISAWNSATNTKDGTYTVGANDASSDLTVNSISAGNVIRRYRWDRTIR